MFTSAVARGTNAPDLFQLMASELARARANKLFPPTTAPTTDTQATAHDYELLLQLQKARMACDSSKHSGRSQDHDQLFVEIARRIRGRDEAYNHEANRDEAVRRVESYLRSVEHEKQHYESIKSSSSSSISSHALSSGPSTPSLLRTDCSGMCPAAGVNEDVLSIYEQAAEQAMCDVARPLMEGLEHYAELHEEMQGLRNEQKALHHQQFALVESQRVLAGEHEENNLQHLKLLDHQTEVIEQLQQRSHDQELACMSLRSYLRGLDDLAEASCLNAMSLQHTLGMAVSATDELSETVVNLPGAIHQVVNDAVHQQTQTALAEMSTVIQRVLVEADEQRWARFITLNDTDLHAISRKVHQIRADPSAEVCQSMKGRPELEGRSKSASLCRERVLAVLSKLKRRF